MSQAADKTKCLNAVGDPTATHKYTLVVWDCQPPSPTTNDAWHWNKKTGNFKTPQPYGGATCDKSNCCLSPLPCTTPCVLPSGWGVVFLLVFSVTTFLYVMGGAGYAIKVQGKDYKTDGVTSLCPHHAMWAFLSGLVNDGAALTSASIQAQIAKARGNRYESVPDVATAATADVNDDEEHNEDDIAE